MTQIRHLIIALAVVFSVFAPVTAPAQPTEKPLKVATVTRAPFSMPDGEGGDTGFSIDLLNLVAAQAGLTISYDRVASFGAMLDAVEAGSVHGAIANISITSAREEVIDFSQPIFDGGVQVMLHDMETGSSRLLSVLFTRDVGLTVLGALVLLLGGGMLMWVFERRKQPYFDLAPKDAIFPAFWWALNLVVNGGFEERMPRSAPGRVFGVFLVVASLFIVSIFVAQITAALTVSAIHETVESINDLDGRQVGTMEGSTSADFLEQRGIRHRTFMDLDTMLATFDRKDLDAVVFDGPILAYHVETSDGGSARMLDRVYRPEKYGMAFPTGSPHRDRISQAILELRENGSYDALLTKWFGNAYTPR